MVKRKVEIATGEIYHVFSRSIARYKIFNNDNEYLRMRESIRFHHVKKIALKFDRYIKKQPDEKMRWLQEQEKLVQIVAYCLMPTHVHLILKQLTDDGIPLFMSNLLNGYARYFNTKHGRKGPLWETRFKNVRVESDEQLLHLTRYLHLNPTTSYLVTKPEEWAFSSYGEYIGDVDADDRICIFDDLLEVDASAYRKFAEDNIDYQKSLADLERFILE